MIKRIAFYDFDGTLIDTPMPETGKPQWKKATGQEYPHLGWWGRIESLSLDVFNIQAFPEIAHKLKLDNSRSDTYTVILTSRLRKLQPYLEEIMKYNNLRVDEMSPKKGGEEKDDRIREFLKRFPDVTSIDLYDDREKEFVIFRALKQELEGKVEVNIYEINNGVDRFKVENVVKDEVQSQIGSIYKETE